MVTPCTHAYHYLCLECLYLHEYREGSTGKGVQGREYREEGVQGRGSTGKGVQGRGSTGKGGGEYREEGVQGRGSTGKGVQGREYREGRMLTCLGSSADGGAVVGVEPRPN